jgi:hypothetical protein
MLYEGWPLLTPLAGTPSISKTPARVSRLPGPRFGSDQTTMPDALLHFILFLRRAPVKSRPSQNPVKCQWLAVHVRLVFACFA